MTIELKCNIPENAKKRHKYVVGKLGDDKLLYAAADRNEEYHDSIAARIKKTQPEFEPLGGGKTAVYPTKIRFDSFSKTYQGVPPEIIDYFAKKIREAYKERFPDTPNRIYPFEFTLASKKNWLPIAEKLGIKLNERNLR
jgi:hypothetical protein